MSFAGTEEPAAYGELISIGGVGPVTNKELSAAISEILESKLSVPPSRFYIKFFDCKVRVILLSCLKLDHEVSKNFFPLPIEVFRNYHSKFTSGTQRGNIAVCICVVLLHCV